MLTFSGLPGRTLIAVVLPVVDVSLKLLLASLVSVLREGRHVRNQSKANEDEVGEGETMRWHGPAEMDSPESDMMNVIGAC